MNAMAWLSLDSQRQAKAKLGEAPKRSGHDVKQTAQQRLRYEMGSTAMERKSKKTMRIAKSLYSKDKKCEECSPTQLQ